MMILVSCLLLILSAASASADQPRDTLARVCDGDAKVYFQSHQDVLELIKLVEGDDGTSCDAMFRDSFVDLKEVLSSTVTDDVCSAEAYLIIRLYYKRYISPYSPEATKEELEGALRADSLKPIPASLRKFFILFVQQISGLCKRDLVARLGPSVANKVRDRDFALMDRIKEEGSRLFGYTYVATPKKLSDLVIPLSRIEASSRKLQEENQAFGSDAAAGESSYGANALLAMQQHLAASAGARDDARKLYIQVRFGDNFMFMQQACVHKFIPVYDELFIPVIRLNNLGFDDQQNTDFEREKLTYEKEFTRWFSVIQTCEVLRDIELVQDTSVDSVVADIARMVSPLKQAEHKDKSRAQVNESKQLVVLSAQEARELRQRNLEAAGRQRAVDVEQPETVQVQHRPVPFTPLMWLSVDPFCTRELDYFDRRNRKLIKKRTDFFTLWKDKLILDLKSRFHRYKLQIVHKDRSSALGSLASFVERHQTAIKIVGSVVAVLVLSIHLG